MSAMASSSTDPALAISGGMRDAKRTLRAQVLSKRDRIPPQARAVASLAIAAALTARDDFAAAQTLLLTLPFGSEWDTRPVVVAARAQGKTVAVPRVNAVTRMLDLGSVTDIECDVAPGYRGIPEPRAHCVPIDVAAIDWILVPGVAFDLAGRRLGYGGGYYDRLLPSLRADAARIAGALELQIVDRVPAAAHDLTVDTIVTETRTISPAR
jgi:5-formyltetrahydrofolate cyclo-ligase